MRILLLVLLSFGFYSVNAADQDGYGAAAESTGLSSERFVYSFRHAVSEPPKDLDDFTLINQDGEQVSLGDFVGQPVLFYFGYTFCPDVCPLTLAEINLAIRAMGYRGRIPRLASGEAL